MSPFLYYPFYLLIVIVFTIALSVKYSLFTDNRINSFANIDHLNYGALLVAIFFILFIGLRPVSGVFIDMTNYEIVYSKNYGGQFNFDSETENLLFDNLLAYMAAHKYASNTFYFIIALLYFGGIYFCCQKLLPRDTLYTFIIYLGALSTFTYATNGIKSGAAASIFLCALPYWKKWIIPAIILFISWGFHHSMILPIVAFLIAKFYTKPKNIFLLWIICILIAAMGITYFQNFFGSIADDSAQEYLTEDPNDDYGYRTGFRLDFILYSSAPLLLGLYLILKKGYQSSFYNFIYCLYGISNAVWILCIQASYTNRIAYLSWFLLPIVLIYPFFDKHILTSQYKKLNVVAWGQLLFTLFMVIFYFRRIVL